MYGWIDRSRKKRGDYFKFLLKVPTNLRLDFKTNNSLHIRERGFVILMVYILYPQSSTPRVLFFNMFFWERFYLKVGKLYTPEEMLLTGDGSIFSKGVRLYLIVGL